MDYQRLYEALDYIQKACNHYQNEEGCQKCPMGNDAGACYFGTREYPSDWKLKEPHIKIME